MTQQTQETYDLDAIASASGIKPDRARLIISELVEKFRFKSADVPANGLVAIISTIVGLQQTHQLSVGQAVAKYVESLQEKQKNSQSTGASIAESIAGHFDQLSTQWAKQLAPGLVIATREKTYAEAEELFREAFAINPFDNCFAEVELILDVKFQEVESQKKFQPSGQENLLTYFALPQGK